MSITDTYNDRQFAHEAVGNDISGIPLANVGAVLDAAGLNWSVEAVPTTYEFNGETLTADRRALIRTDTGMQLGTHSEAYCRLENSSLVDLAAAAAGDGGHGIEFRTGGEMDGGRVVWLNASLGSNPRFDGLGISKEVTVVKSHDGTLPLTFIPSAVRMFCRNQFPMLRKQHGRITVKHTRNSELRLIEAKAAVTALYAAHDTMDVMLADLLETEVTNKRFEEIAREVLGDWSDEDATQKARTQRENMWNVISETWKANDDLHGNGLGAVNAFNDFDLWDSTIRSDRTRPETQLNQLVKGTMPRTYAAADLILA